MSFGACLTLVKEMMVNIGALVSECQKLLGFSFFTCRRDGRLFFQNKSSDDTVPFSAPEYKES